MAISIHIEFKGVGSKRDLPNDKDVVWELNETVPGKALVNRGRGTTRTTPAGVLIIDQVDLGADESLQLKYTIGTQTGIILIKHNDASKAGQPLVITHYLSLTVKIKFLDRGNKDEPIRTTPVRWQLEKIVFGQRNPVVVQPETDDNTDAEGRLIKDIDISGTETFSLTYTIERQSDKVQLKHNDATRSGNALEIEKKVKLTEIARAEAAPVAAAAVPITNPQSFWLTYESLFNKDKFRKPCCEFKLGLYLIPINDVWIWLRDDVSDAHLKAFVNAFFPDFEARHIKDLANSFWSWKDQKAAEFWILQFNEESAGQVLSSGFFFSPRQGVGNRDRMIEYLTPYAVLPYNRFDNTAASCALATTNHDNNLLRIKEEAPYFWSAWKTASRSCIVRLPARATKAKGILWKTGDPASIARDYTPWAYDASHRGPGFEALKNNPYNLSERIDAQDFSLKTGVEFIGKNNQGGYKHKDVIGEWIIGCLRSDYINYIDKTLKPPKDGLIILTELITITEKKTRDHPGAKSVHYREGIQIRDISVLDKSKIYLAPLNIPFVGLDFQEYNNEHNYFRSPGNVSDAKKEEWYQFWKLAFAAALGRTKALMLLRYGLQIVNPNQQNFLIEFQERAGKIEPTGTLVVRDLNDASIHREVAWAFFSDPQKGELPPQDNAAGERLAELKVPVLEFEFSKSRMPKEGFANQDPADTGTKIEGQDFGPSGTQFLWQRFSAFVNLDKGADVQEDPVLSHPQDKNLATPVYKNLLTAMADWGMAHNKSYISCIERHLGKNFREIDWARCPNPSRYQAITTIGQTKSEIIPKRAEKSSLTPGLEITSFSCGKLSEDIKRRHAAAFGAVAQGRRDLFFNERCLQIHGTGFADRVVVKLGTTEIKSEYVVSTPNMLFISDMIEIDGVLRKGSNITVSNANAVDRPAIYKFVDDPDYLDEIRWEETSAKVIHNYLASSEGQAALRKLKNGWNLASTSFTIRFTGPDAKPFAWKRVFLKNAFQEWTDLTNANGEIHIYSDRPWDFRICPQIDESVAAVTQWLACLSQTWGTIEIQIL